MHPKINKINQRNFISMVYAIYNHYNNKFYIGKAGSGFDRWKQHYWDAKCAKKGKDSKVVLSKDWRDKGYNWFGFHVVKQKQTPCYIDQLEAFLIKRWNPSYNVQLIDKTKEQAVNSFVELMNDRDKAIQDFENAYLPEVLINHLQDGLQSPIGNIWDWMTQYNLYCIGGKVEDRKRKFFNALTSKGYVSLIKDQWIVKIK